MEMVYVPAGEFKMGTPQIEINDLLKANPDLEKVSFSDEFPQHSVYLDAFWIDKFEVTNEMFAKFVAAENYKTGPEQQGWGYVYNGSIWDITK